MKKAYSYVRMSTPEQLKGDSLRRQLEASQAWCNQHGYNLDSSLRDIGISAFKGLNRLKGSLGRFIELAESGEIPPGSVLLLESLDRLSRQEVLTALATFTEILRLGIEIVTLADGQHYRHATLDISNLIISLVVMARAHDESKMKSQRGEAVWARKRKDAAEKPLTAQVPNWLKLDRRAGEIVEIPDRVAIVQEIFEKTIAGQGRYIIASDLNRRGIKTWGGGVMWHDSYVIKLLTNRAVLGEYQPHTGSGKDRKPIGDPIPNYFPRIISEEDFYRAAHARQSRRHAGGRRGRRFSNLFTGIAKCSCGASMRFVDKGAPPKGYKYLTCSSAKASNGCNHHRHYLYEDFEKMLLWQLSQHADWHSPLSGKDSKNLRLARERDAAQARLAEIEKLIARYFQDFESPDNALYAIAREKLSELGAEKQALASRIEQLSAESAESAGAEDLGSALLAVSSSIGKTEAELFDNRARLHQILSKLIEQITFAPGPLITAVLADGRSITLSEDEQDYAALTGRAELDVEEFMLEFSTKLLKTQ